MRPLASRLDLIPSSPTLALDSKAKAMKAQGLDIVNFSIGEPDFDTPKHIRQAAIEAIEKGFTRYTAVDGIEELKQAICGKFLRDNALDYKPEQIVVSNGGKHSLYNTFMTLFEPGAEVIIPAPHWVSYAPQITLAGASPVFVQTTEEDDYLLSAELLDRHINSRTRGLVINSPSNPTGMAYDEKRLKALSEVIIKHDLWVISDDMYEKIVFDGFKFANIPMVEPNLYDRTVITHGLSKTYAMTGWRIGFLAAPIKVAKAAAKLQSQTTANPCSISQKAAVAALNGPQESVAEMVASFQQRRDLVMELIGGIENIYCPKPQGAFYVFPNFSAYLGKKYQGRALNTIDDLSTYLLEKALVAIVPGSSFGDPNTMRISYAVSEDDIRAGFQRMKEALAELKK